MTSKASKTPVFVFFLQKIAILIQKQKSLPLYAQIWTGLVNQPHLLLILLKHAKELGKVKLPSYKQIIFTINV